MSVTQVLLLWDRLLAANSLSLLAVAAAGLVMLHGSTLLQALPSTSSCPGGSVDVQALDTARGIFTRHAEAVVIVPLCQMVLFAAPSDGRQ